MTNSQEKVKLVIHESLDLTSNLNNPHGLVVKRTATVEADYNFEFRREGITNNILIIIPFDDIDDKIREAHKKGIEVTGVVLKAPAGCRVFDVPVIWGQQGTEIKWSGK